MGTSEAVQHEPRCSPILLSGAKQRAFVVKTTMPKRYDKASGRIGCNPKGTRVAGELLCCDPEPTFLL